MFCRFDHLPLPNLKVATLGYLFLWAGTDTIDFLFKFETIFYCNASCILLMSLKMNLFSDVRDIVHKVIRWRHEYGLPRTSFWFKNRGGCPQIGQLHDVVILLHQPESFRIQIKTRNDYAATGNLFSLCERYAEREVASSISRAGPILRVLK